MLQGLIRGIEGNNLVGWLFDDAQPERIVEFELFAGPAEIGRYRADQTGPEPVGIGDHWFSVPLDEARLKAPRLNYSVRLDGKRLPGIEPWAKVQGSPGGQVPPARAGNPVRGKIERIDGDLLVGWMADPIEAEPVRFELAINGIGVGNYVADGSRDDLGRFDLGRREVGFAIKLLPEWLTASENRITIRPLSRRMPLPSELVLVVYTQPQIERWSSDTAPLALAVRQPPSSQEPLLPREMAAQMRDWSTTRLAAFHATFEKDVLLERAKQLFRDRNWPELALLAGTARPDRLGRGDLDLLIGRALLYENRADEAAEILARLAGSLPKHAGANFYASVASSRAGNHRVAVEFGRNALLAEPDNQQFLIEHAVQCRRYARDKDSDTALRHRLLIESTASLDRALALRTDRVPQCLMLMARNQLELDRFADAFETLEKLLALAPEHADALALQSQALVAMGRFTDAVRVLERLVALDPDRLGPRFQLRSLRLLAGGAEEVDPTFGILRHDESASDITLLRLTAVDAATEPVATLPVGTPIGTVLERLGADWILLERVPVDRGRLAEALPLAQARAGGRAGRLVHGEADGTGIVFWRRELLLSLIESDVLAGFFDASAALDAIAPLIATQRLDLDRTSGIDMPAITRPIARGPALLVSRHGVVKFGGGEQFLDSMADHYDALGFESIVVGTRPERVGEAGVEGGRRFAFVAAEAEAIRAFVLRTRPTVVHVLSGLGFEFAEALEFLDVPIVYGVHFWRDCLGARAEDPQFFVDHDKGPIPRETFRSVIQTAASIYSNSEYTRAVLEEAFSFRTPLAYSLPREVDPSRHIPEDEVAALLSDWRDYLLLVNAKADKGFDLVLEVAKATPEARFLVVASQSDRSDADAAVALASLTNMRVIGHTDRMDILYTQARAVAVPSYRFVETFSRVCIEAQRYGKPVLGSDVGNVPYLLRQSGIVLPERLDDWVVETRRLFLDESYYQARCEQARQNSARYGYASQFEAIDGIVAGLGPPILIGVGSGIGNMLHVAPMIRNIARRLGRKVDLVVNEDHAGSLFVLHDDRYVNSVFALRPEVLRRRYHTVFLTHSFGVNRPNFRADHVLNARDWINFEPGGEYHETVYNLESAKQLLGVDYDEADVRQGYLANYRYRRRPMDGAPIRIGMHGGSKDGFWQSKRWPGHAELARRLQERGYEVASFGLPQEYVPGTIDMTGGSIREMVDRMLDLDYFVSNDSGLMNICNALGVPVFAIFAPTNPATRAPLGTNSRWIALQKSCAPCEITVEGRRTFQAGACRCIAEIAVDEVERAVLAHLAELDADESAPLLAAAQ